jgi:hypothetical protein
MLPLDKKHKAVRLASRIFATVLFPGREGWQAAQKETEKVLMNLAEQRLLEEQENSPAQKRKEKKQKLQELREHLFKKKQNKS